MIRGSWVLRNLALSCGLLVTACNFSGGTSSSQFGSSTGGTDSSSSSNPAAANVLSVTVGGSSLCGGNINAPCASVTVCVPGTSQCQTISDLLVDTGSYGLRIFSQALTLSLPAVNASNGKPVAECAQFGTGNDWGPVVTASVQLGGESSVDLPIQLINSTYSTIPSGTCSNPDTSPSSAGYNGILGVGLFTHDCGTYCANTLSNGVYFSCSGGTCSATKLALSDQVQNPVSLLPADNNGVVLDLPSVSSTSGESVAYGTLTLGIGTETNNTPAGVTTYSADGSGNFTTKFNSQTYNQSFIDSGSNGLFFPPPSGLTNCSSSSSAPGWYCPSSTKTYSATNVSSSGSPSGSVSFQIANASNLVSNGNAVFNDVGADLSGSGLTSFDWGLPFFLGKKVYVGIGGMQSTLGTGPYWAY